MNNLILKIVADNQNLFDELKQTIIAEFGVDSIINPDNRSNEDLGAITRARLDGVKAVERAFKKISQHKTVAGNVENKNPAR